MSVIPEINFMCSNPLVYISSNLLWGMDPILKCQTNNYNQYKENVTKYNGDTRSRTPPQSVFYSLSFSTVSIQIDRDIQTAGNV